MAVEITVPRLGWSMEEGVFSQWLKHDGDTIREGDALFELESDKAVQQVESFDAGVLSIPPDGPKPGEMVKVGQRIGYLCRKGEATPSGDAPVVQSNVSETPSERLVSEPAAKLNDANTIPTEFTERSNGTHSDRPVASPSVRRLARQMGVDVRSIEPQDAAGRITVEQVLATRQAVNGTDPPLPFAAADASQPTLRVSPRAARSAMRLGVNLLDVTATGASGRIRERDVFAAARGPLVVQPPQASGIATVPPGGIPTQPTPAGKKDAASSLRRTIAARMLAAAQQTASVTLQSSADATEMVSLRKQFKAASSDSNVRVLSFTDLFVKLTAAALGKHPAMLGQWTDAGILNPHGIHIAVAVDTPAGLLTPVLRDVPELTLSQISGQLHDLITRARSRRASADELQGGVFTISNLGSYRIDGFTPLLNLPQTAILGIGRISQQPTVIDGRVEVRDRVSLSLTFDHRVVDGATAAALLTTICELVERPLPTLLS